MNKWLSTHTPYDFAWLGETMRASHEFARDVAQTAALLAQQSETELALFCTDSYWFAVGLYAAWQAGKRVHLPGDALHLPRLPCTLRLADAEEHGLVIAELARYDGHVHLLQPLDAERCEVVLYTSGSTGEPKPVHKVLRQLQNECEKLEALFGQQVGSAVMLSTVSHQHLYGLLLRIIWPVQAGRIFAAQAAFHPEELMAQSLALPRVAWVSSPAHYKRMDDALPWDAVRPHLVALFSSAGVLPTATASHLAELTGQPVSEIFGSTETGGVAVRQGDAPWQAMPGITVSQADSGALTIVSPHLPDLAPHVMDDAIALEADGRFRLLGRLDRVVKLEEKRIALASIESALVQLSEVLEAAVLAVEEHGRQQVLAVLVLSETGLECLATAGRKAFIEALKQTLRQRIEAVAMPRRWRFVRQLPLNAQGKVMHQALLALFRHTPQPTLLPELMHAESHGHEHQLTLLIDAKVAYFNGHFPGAPILPGVTQIHWAVQFARQFITLPPAFLRMDAIKFQQVITPGQVVHLTLSWHPDKQRLNFAYVSERGNHSSGRLEFA